MIGIDFDDIDKTQRYQLLCSAVIPRPIAFISTIDSSTGVKNLAPLSFFSCVTCEPPTVMFSVTRKRDGSKKDTLVNIEHGKDFVINHVTKVIFPQMYDASAELPPEMDEFNVVGLTAVPSVKVVDMHIDESLHDNGVLNVASITTISRLGNMSYGHAEKKFDYEKEMWNVSNW